ncbi:MAG: hypothetical protein COA67_12355 [Lutibacter sp.]|nr:MAG: hypothetical protein COA67_12355 [Lutibacter sp.]
MKFKISYLIIFSFLYSFSQQSENYTKLANQLIPTSSDSIVDKFKNGNIKREATLTTYTIEEIEYPFYTGKYTTYKRNGRKTYERVMDMFGMPLSSKVYYGGELFSSTKTLEIDTQIVSVEEFLMSRKGISIIYEYSEYYIDKNKKPILWKKGIMVNGKKSGKWITYKDGQIHKTNTYKNRDKFKNLLKSDYIK